MPMALLRPRLKKASQLFPFQLIQSIVQLGCLHDVLLILLQRIFNPNQLGTIRRGPFGSLDSKFRQLLANVNGVRSLEPFLNVLDASFVELMLKDVDQNGWNLDLLL